MFPLHEDPMTGETLRDLRKTMKLTQAELGEKIGMSTTWIGQMERGSAPIEKVTAMAVAAVWAAHTGPGVPSYVVGVMEAMGETKADMLVHIATHPEDAEWAAGHLARCQKVIDSCLALAAA